MNPQISWRSLIAPLKPTHGSQASRAPTQGLPNTGPPAVPGPDRPFAELPRPRSGLCSSAAGCSHWLYLSSAPQDICWRWDSVLCVHAAPHRGSLSTSSVGEDPGQRRLQPPLTRRVSPPISVHAARTNDTGRQRTTSQLVASRVLAAVYSIWELLFVWCLQSARCSQLFWELTLRCSPAVVWLGLASPPRPCLGVTQRSSSSPTPSSRAIPADHAWGLDTKCCGQLFASLGEEGVWKCSVPEKKQKIPEILQNPVYLLHSLWTGDVIMVDVVTHSHMDSRGPRTWANGCICCASLGRQQQQKLSGFFFCHVKR